MIFLVNRSLSNIHHGKDRKDEGLKCADKYTEALPHCHKWYTEETHLQNNRNQYLARKNVSEQPDCQGNRFGQILDNVKW